VLSQEKQEQIAIIVINVLRGRFESFPADASKNRNAPFHKAFLEAFTNRLQPVSSNVPYLVSLSSWLHGLDTTLGQTFFEGVAHVLSDGEKREFAVGELTISSSQQQTISRIMSDLKNGKEHPSIQRENHLIFTMDDSEIIDNEKFAADNFVETSDYVEAIELKTVRPNSGIAYGEKQKILKGKAGLWRKHPEKQIRFYIAFPFDPLNDTATGSNKSRLMKFLIEFDKYFDPNEVLVAEELWNHLSGSEKTMEEILQIINRIATPEFLNRYDYLSNSDNRHKDRKEYINLLNEWYLFRERWLVEHDDDIMRCCKSKKRLERFYNQTVFTSDGEYNEKRYSKLSECLKAKYLINSFKDP